MAKMVVSPQAGRTVHCCVLCDVSRKFSDDRKIGKNPSFGGHFLRLLISPAENS